MIDFKTTSDIEFEKTLFLIPSYQRGYRWQADDVQKLLLDLTRFSGKDYCLQPLELQITSCPEKLKDCNYEKFIRVVDGQQRLTTISIIAKHLNIPLEWDIYYITEGMFLSKLLQDDSKEETINAHFRHVVKTTVEGFAEIDDVAKYIAPESEYGIVFPVHFLPDDNRETEEADKGQSAFNRLNAGKTPLTSSELIRALYMVHDSGLDDQQRIEISKEWELIENTLANEQFWLMFNAVGLKNTPTRIDLLFALVLKIDLQKIYINPRLVYEELESGYYEKRYDLQKVWGAVMRCFWWMQSCYEDIECFNYLCWISMCTANQASTIYDDHLSYPNMDNFKKALVKRIQENGICSIPMRYGEPRLKDLLLLCNVLECNNNKERLRFDSFDGYDIEHIDSQTPNDLSEEKDRKEWLESVFDEYEDLRDGMSREVFCSQVDIDGLITQVKKLNGENAVKDGDGLGNLVLLNSNINRSYKNAVFPRKRKVIRDALEKGTQYILPCTAKAFMKFYTRDASRIHAWLQQDYQGYQDAMNALISQIPLLPITPPEVFPNNTKPEPEAEYSSENRDDSSSKEKYVCLRGEVSFEQIMDTYRIRIPKIQRLYVQGRQDSYGKKCLKDFANVLVDSVCNGTPCPLDMVYGIADGNVFKPLDGQQRLTTLLLLFWLCGKTNKVNGEKWVFDYESRRSTELFIANLLDTTSPLNNQTTCKKCSDYLAKQPWFMPIWKHDPGIAGMLNMLDSLFEKLLNSKKSAKDFQYDKMTFSINYLDVAAAEYDHIFLKMNSRGRQLTAWENVKAVIDKYASYHPDWKDDINWTWPERIWLQVNKNITVLDNNMLVIISEALAYAAYDGKADDTFQLDKWMKGNPDKVERFFTCAETLLSATEIKDELILQAITPLWETTPLKPVFSNIDASCKKHLAAYYAAKKSTNADWMRVIWNIVENSNAGNNLPSALKLIDELAEHREGILEFLASDAKINSQFAQVQVNEEREKAKLICNVDGCWQGIFKEAEAYPFIKGRVSVILEASGKDKSAFSNIVSFCAQKLQTQENMIEFFKSYLSYAQNCDLPLPYDYDFFNPGKWKQMFFDNLGKKGVIVWLKSIINSAEESQPILDWAANLQKHWNEICPDGPNEYWQIAQYSNGWDNNKVFLYRKGYITKAQLISSSLREELLKGLSIDDKSKAWHFPDSYHLVVVLENGLSIIVEPSNYVWVKYNEKPLATIGSFQLPVQLTLETLKDFTNVCLDYK